MRLTDTRRAGNGKIYLVMHGDALDNVVLYARWLAYVNDRAYGADFALNTFLNGLRRLLGMRYWSKASYLKVKVKYVFNLSVISREPWCVRLNATMFKALFAGTFTRPRWNKSGQFNI